MTSISKLDSFVGSRSWLLFNKLGDDGHWMTSEVPDWDNDDEYKRMRHTLKDEGGQ